MSPVACAFCERVIPDRAAHLTATEYSIAFLDAFPSAPGHTLLVPRRHVALLSELTDEEHADLFSLLRMIVTGSAGNASARTIGINDGPLAGQTVPHLHLHVVPRSEGDVEDPRGGVRWVLPATAAYWDRTT